MKNLTKTLMAAVLAAITCSANAGTVGYWRFENNGNLGQDFSGNNYNLATINGSISERITDSGPGEGFPKTVPQTGATNELGARVFGSGGVTNVFYRDADAAFQVRTQFTIEAFISLTNFNLASTFTAPIASRWRNVSSQFNWMFGLYPSSGTIRPRMLMYGTRWGTNGASINAMASAAMALQLNRDYYIAGVYSNGICTIYLAELTNNPVLMSETLNPAGGWPTNLAVVSAPFMVGAYQSTSSATNYLPALLDEVRYSDTALAINEFVFSPATGPVVLKTSPKSLEAALGTHATFTASAQGALPLSYQWYDAATSLPLEGKTASSLVVSNVTLADSGKSYYVVVTNAMNSVTSTPPAVLTVVDASGATVGHWRFENGGNLGLSSASGGLNLPGVGGSPAGLVLPDAGSGPGGYFLKNVPKPAGPTNQSGLSLDGLSWLSRNAGAGVAVSTQMTVEAFFNLSTAQDNNTMPIASQWDQPAGQRTWIFGVLEDNAAVGQIGDLRLRFSMAGAWSQNASRWILQPNVDYYAAVTLNGTNVTFYLANLSAAEPVVEAQSYTNTVASLPASLAEFRVGALREGTGDWGFPGLLDEVRFSRVSLPATSLLNPPPASPTIDQAPQDVAVGEGANAGFSVTALGGLPLYYQWYQGSTANPIAGATNITLTLTNVTLAQSGTTYFVVVTNTSGRATSAPPALLTVVNVSSPTVGYWRFEDGGNLGLDSSGSGLNLTNAGSPAIYALPVSGSGQPGAEFPKTIPGTGQANANALNLDATSWLAYQDWPSFSLGNTMAIEVMFNASYFLYNDLSSLASQWDDQANQRSWFLGVRESAAGSGVYQLRFGLNRAAWVQNATRWNLSPNKDYYAAVVFTNGLVTFYLADLSAPNPVLESQTFTASVTSIQDQTGEFRVGAYRNGSGSVIGFPGLIDEVRLSRAALPYYSLLNPPPPAPRITTQPADQVVGSGVNATFSVTCFGTPPLSYQWYKESLANPVSEGVASRLVLSNVQPSQAGNYFVVVTNTYGADTSSVAVLTVVDTSLPTIAHWRFENSGNLGLNSAGNYLHMTNNGSPLGVPLPAGGSGQPGEWFPKTIPQTGAANTAALQLDGMSACLATPDQPFLGGYAQLTVESFFNTTSFADELSEMILSQYTSAAGTRGFLFYAREDNFIVGTLGTPRLRFAISGDGANNFGEWAPWALLPNHDYYAAAVYNAGTVTYYLADLTNANPVVLSAKFMTYPTRIFDSPSPVEVGIYHLSATTSNLYSGLVDEVRMSRLALNGAQLLLPPFPAVPQNLTAVASTTNTAVLLSWNAAVNAVSYNVKRSLTNGGAYAVIANTANTAYVDVSAVPNVPNYYVISAVGVGDESGNSAQASATPVSAAPQPAILPVYLDATGTNLVVRADTVSGHSYVLEEAPGLEPPVVWTPVLTNSGGGMITNLVPITQTPEKRFYRYNVR